MTSQSLPRTFNVKTGEVRPSTPPDIGQLDAVPIGPTEPDSGSLATAVEQSPHPKNAVELDQADAMQTDITSLATPDALPPVLPVAKQKAAAKPKVEIETLEQYIGSVYASQGRKFSLSAKELQSISRAPKLTEDEKNRLIEQANGDQGFEVPKQLLLTACGILGFPGVANSLREFVRARLYEHALFKNPVLQATLRNTDEALALPEVIKVLLESDPSVIAATARDAKKDVPFKMVQQNCITTISIWIADVKGLTTAQLIDGLHSAVWGPAARKIKDVPAQLRLLTEVDDVVAMGVACEEYQRQLIAKASAINTATGEAAALRVQVSTLESALTSLQAESASTALLDSSRITDLQTQLEETQNAARLLGAGLRDDHEQLRTRVLRRLKSDVALLEDGMHALRQPQPRVNVMVDIAERTTDALREEIKRLQGEH